MKYQLEKSEGKVKFTFTILPQEWEEEVNNVYLKSKHRFSVPGFRKGHAPRRTIENYYGKGVFFDDAINNAIKHSYSKALDENPDVYPVDEPKVDIDKFDENEIVFTLEVIVKPEVKLGAYTGIILDKVEYTVKQDDVKAVIERDRKAHARRTEIKDRAVQDGDILTIDYSGKVDDVKFDGGTAQNQQLKIGSKTFIPGFEEQLIGMNLGETKDITVKFPDDYHAENLKGKDAVFTVTVHSGHVEEIPEADDGFAQEMGPYETFDQYKKDVEKKLKEDAKKQSENVNIDNVFNQVVANAQFTVPDSMVESELNYELQNLANGLRQSGLKLEDYFKYLGTSEKEFKDQRREEALKTVKSRLVMEALIKELEEQGKIDATDAEVEEKIIAFAERNQISVDEVKESPRAAYFKDEVLSDKAVKFLLDNNTFIKKSKKAEAKKTDDAKTEVKEEVKSEAKEEVKEEAQEPQTEKPKAKRTRKTQKSEE